MEEFPEKKILFHWVPWISIRESCLKRKYLFSLGSLDLDMGELPEKKIPFFIGFPGP